MSLFPSSSFFFCLHPQWKQWARLPRGPLVCYWHKLRHTQSRVCTCSFVFLLFFSPLGELDRYSEGILAQAKVEPMERRALSSFWWPGTLESEGHFHPGTEVTFEAVESSKVVVFLEKSWEKKAEASTSDRTSSPFHSLLGKKSVPTFPFHLRKPRNLGTLEKASQREEESLSLEMGKQSSVAFFLHTCGNNFPLSWIQALFPMGSCHVLRSGWKGTNTYLYRAYQQTWLELSPTYSHTLIHNTVQTATRKVHS